MRHNVYGAKLSRTKNERRRLFQGLVKDLIKHGAIETSLAKAKAIQPMVDKLITTAKKGKAGQFRMVQRTLADKAVATLFLGDIQTRFTNRPSGFTRVIRLGQQSGDATEQVRLQFVDERVVTEDNKSTLKRLSSKK